MSAAGMDADEDDEDDDDDMAHAPANNSAGASRKRGAVFMWRALGG